MSGMINPSVIDERVDVARARDNAVCEKLLAECARMVVIDQYQSHLRSFSLDSLISTLKPARVLDSGNTNPNTATFPVPEPGSFAYQLYSAICFVIDARAELKLLELIQSPHFYSALMRSAAEVQP